MGWYWAMNFAIANLTSREPMAPMAWLPLLGFLTPLLRFLEKRWLQHIAFWLCLFEVLLSVLFWLGSMVHYGDPRGFRVRLLGFPIATVWSSGGQFLYFALRALAFAVAAILISTVPRNNLSKDTAPASNE